MMSPVWPSTPSSISPQAATDNKPHASKYPVFLNLIRVLLLRLCCPKTARTVAHAETSRALLSATKSVVRAARDENATP
jgi:hypothetical protein